MEANYFTILYWFCHTSTWICHGCTCAPHPEPPPTFYFFFFFLKFKFIYFNWRLITLLYCIGFAIHQHESATGVLSNHVVVSSVNKSPWWRAHKEPPHRHKFRSDQKGIILNNKRHSYHSRNSKEFRNRRPKTKGKDQIYIFLLYHCHPGGFEVIPFFFSPVIHSVFIKWKALYQNILFTGKNK